MYNLYSNIRNWKLACKGLQFRILQFELQYELCFYRGLRKQT